MLSLVNVEVTYDPFITVVRGISFEVPKGSIVVLLGPNGAGKSTTLKAISGLVYAERGRVTKGHIYLDGTEITNWNPTKIARKCKISHVLEGRRVFEELSVKENLLVGMSNGDLDLAYNYFPRLRELSNLRAGYISGGEQQMLVIARHLLTRPKLMLLDEPSLGLAPKLVDELFCTIKSINENEGVTILLVEQNARKALQIADYGYVVNLGRIVMEGDSEKLAKDKNVVEMLMGLEGFKRIRAYSMRKRWIS